MPGFLDKILSGGAKAVIDTVANTVDRFVQTKDEKDAIMQEVTKETNRHFEAMQSDATKQIELEIQDRSNARTREAEFVKATGHVDYMMWFLAVAAITIFCGIVWHLVKLEVPKENRELLTNIVGLIEGVLISIYSYYWGSSQGSRLKDMKPK